MVFLFAALFLPSTALAATLALSPNSGTVNPSCSFSTDILLDTAGAKVDGVDVILKYDPTKLTPTITTGKIFPSYPLSNVDPQQAKISISGVASVGQPYTTPSSGPEKFATVNFTVVQQAGTGLANVAFDFDPQNIQKTTDSNVIEDGTTNELLNSVTDGSFKIGSGACNTQVLTTTPGVSTPGASLSSALPGKGGVASTNSAITTAIPLKTLPAAGGEGLTLQLAIFGGLLSVLGVIGIVLL